MSTLIAVYDGHKCLARCDHTCYDGTGHDCRCVCLGHNHGIGQQAAAINTRRHWRDWLRLYFGHAFADDNYRILFGLAVRQRECFVDLPEAND